MCEMISERYPMPEDFFQSVMNRENTASTDIGIRSALPHPDRLIPESTMIAVGVLRKPVFWGKKEVSLVILALIMGLVSPPLVTYHSGSYAGWKVCIPSVDELTLYQAVVVMDSSTHITKWPPSIFCGSGVFSSP